MDRETYYANIISEACPLPWGTTHQGPEGEVLLTPKEGMPAPHHNQKVTADGDLIVNNLTVARGWGILFETDHPRRDDAFTVYRTPRFANVEVDSQLAQDVIRCGLFGAPTGGAWAAPWPPAR